MSKFKYSDNQMVINKVLKMNQNMSKEILNDIDKKNIRTTANNNISSSLEILKSLDKNKELDKLSSDIKEKNSSIKLENKPVIESWESIVKQANLSITSPVVLEDLMTESEIAQSFNELDEINKIFSKKTSIINKRDLTFLTIATALQVAKILIFPYVAEKFNYGESFDVSERLDHNDKSIEKAHRDANNKFKDKHIEKHGEGKWIELVFQTPPYDVTSGSKDLGINMGGKYHRMYTLGHDPILGWIFGTANILTDCISFNTFQTNRVSRIDPLTGMKKMKITSEVVPIGVMFKECYDMIKSDRLNLPAALFAQAQHFKSDEFTKLGLPVPILPSINEKFASKLYSENYDALCFSRDIKIVGSSFVVSKIIDIIISLIHGLFRDEAEDKDLFEIKTRKILLISNSIASTSSIINTAITSNPKKLDIGSLLNTLTHLFTDIRFITKIKQEFIESEISKKLQIEIDEIDKIFDEI